MARGRIFSSRRMFSTRRDAFAEPSRNSGPLGVVLGLTAAGIIIFAIGIYVGAKFPSSFGFGAPAPMTPAEAEAPAMTFAPETPTEPEAVEPADGITPEAAPQVVSPDAAAPDAAVAPEAPAVEAPAPVTTAPAPTPAPEQTTPAQTPAPATP